MFEKMIDYVLLNQKTLLEKSGEYALKNTSDNYIQYSTQDHIFASQNLDSYDYYKCDQQHACYLANRCGYGAWLVPKWIYPSRCADVYDKWHKYCDMTDYKGLKDRLEKNYTIKDVYEYYKIRANRIWEVRYKWQFRNQFLKFELKALGMLLKIINFITGKKDDVDNMYD